MWPEQPEQPWDAPGGMACRVKAQPGKAWSAINAAA